MKIYTKTGDKGTTSLIGGTKVSKGHLRIEAYGTVDELNSYIGIVQSKLKPKDSLLLLLAEIQNNLFVMGALLAADPEKSRMALPELKLSDVEKLEKAIDQMDEALEPLKAFILPSGSEGVAHCHVARCVCRRAERTVVRLSELTPVEPVLIIYLNRLSDFLFTLSRKIGKDFGVEEVIWQS
ncbi:MAG: cob(I)yrinic acid a,c-diamide adenosyltransferase [Chitinophagales bacterium]